ncbi:MAG: hypothetical protein LBC49_01320, partial [Bacteroidales bacterium]|nr:hypothetical protein [Bacteroidales bacterium]
ENFESTQHDYSLDFTKCDEKIFPKKEWEDLEWYLSNQYSAENFICVSICHYIDCGSYISLHIIDTTFKITDKLCLLIFRGCEPGDIYAHEFRYENNIISYEDAVDDDVVHFENDSIFTVISDIEHFIIEDTVTKERKEEIGSKTEKKYLINSSGKFVEIENRSFTKEYVRPFWDSYNP